MILYVGIDMSLKDFKVRVMDASGRETAKRFRAENNRPGSNAFVTFLIEACVKTGATHLVLGLESTSVYSWHLQMFLAEEPRLTSIYLRMIGQMPGLSPTGYALEDCRTTARLTFATYLCSALLAFVVI